MKTPAAQKLASSLQDNAPQLLTAQELARALRLNPQTLYRLARRGVIPSIRIGGKSLRFDPVRVRDSFEPKHMPATRPKRERQTFKAGASTRLEDLIIQNRWTASTPDVTLKRFAVKFPPRADLTALAYEKIP